MRDSTTYQAILDEGRIEVLHRVILRLGRHRFGEPDDTTRQRTEANADIDAPRKFSVRLLKVASWEELPGD